MKKTFFSSWPLCSKQSCQTDIKNNPERGSDCFPTQTFLQQNTPSLWFLSAVSLSAAEWRWGWGWGLSVVTNHVQKCHVARIEVRSIGCWLQFGQNTYHRVHNNCNIKHVHILPVGTISDFAGKWSFTDFRNEKQFNYNISHPRNLWIVWDVRNISPQSFVLLLP